MANKIIIKGKRKEHTAIYLELDKLCTPRRQQLLTHRYLIKQETEPLTTAR
jgi:hypothetical protein